MNSRIVQPEGNFYDKYHSKNPIVQWMMKNYFKSLDDMLIRIGKVKNILEAGCGEGEVINFIGLKQGEECALEAFDISEKVIRQASLQFPKVKFKQGDIYNMSSGGVRSGGLLRGIGTFRGSDESLAGAEACLR